MTVGDEQVPEQQKRQKTAIEFSRAAQLRRHQIRTMCREIVRQEQVDGGLPILAMRS